MHYKLLCHWVQLSATYLLCCSILCFGDLPMLVHRAVCGHFNSVEHSVMLLHHMLFVHLLWMAILRLLQASAITNNTSMNISCHILVVLLEFLQCLSMSGIANSRGLQIPGLIYFCQMGLQSVNTNLAPPLAEWKSSCVAPHPQQLFSVAQVLHPER